MRKLLAIAAFAAAFGFTANAQWAYQKKVFTSSDGLAIPYQIHLPDRMAAGEQYPLLLFLHGAGERGVDGDLQMVHGKDLFQSDPLLENAIVIAPQCPNWDMWSGHVDIGHGDLFPDVSIVTPSQKAVKELLDCFLGTGLADPDRVYATGLSMGGMGVIDMAVRWPDLFAAVQPMCGGASNVWLQSYKGHADFRFFHGTIDDDVLYEYAQDAVRILQGKGVNAELVSYAGVGHACWDSAFAEPDFISWMFSRRRSDNGLRAMSYNIRCATALDGSNAWDKRKAASAAMILAEHPDVFGVQEAVGDQVDFLNENLPGYKGVGVGRENGKKMGEHMSVFFNTERVELVDWGTYWLSETPDKPSKGWDAACKRTATWTKLRMKASGREFYFVNTHLDHVGVEAREKGLALIVDRIAEMNPEKLPMVLTGDFNILPDNPGLEALGLRMQSARKTAAVSDVRPSYNSFGKGTNTEIDYIWYAGFDRALNFEVLCNPYAGIPYISDHYPVRSDLVF